MAEHNLLKTHRVTADGTSAGKNKQLKPILITLVKIQRVPVKKKGTDAATKMLEAAYKRFKAVKNRWPCLQLLREQGSEKLAHQVISCSVLDCLSSCGRMVGMAGVVVGGAIRYGLSCSGL